ncbi:MAG: UvrD-helicase domain-containing protein [Myxococcales bacterium]|nr:UvrD-helicase domain-containing protein [Myxococcales bacterium]
MDLTRLNPPQREAVLAREKALLVLAGAGSGKTRVIAHRIVHLLEQKTPPEAILAVTFTNKAAAEMKARVLSMAGPRAEGVSISTFHSFGAGMLRQHAPKLGLLKRFAIADPGDQLALVRRAMRERRVDDRSFDAWRVLTLISRAKNAGTEPEPAPEGRGGDYDLVAHLAFPLYQRGLRAQGAVDFDDLLVLPLRLLEEDAEVRDAYARRFRHLLVDEFQDTNLAQMKLLMLLSAKATSVCAVGDDDQSIYGWRGAEIANVLQFERCFPGAMEIRLEQNYRSTRFILEAANAVIAQNPSRRHKRLWTAEEGGSPLSVVIAPDEVEEARYVAHEIGKAMAGRLSPDEVAVLYRTNGQSGPVEEALREKGIPYEVIGGMELFDRRDVKDTLGYLKALANPRDELALLRVVNVPPRGIGDVTVERVQQFARERGVPLWKAMESAAGIEGLPRGAAEKLSEFCALVERYRVVFRKGNLAGATRELLTEIGLREAARLQSRSAAQLERRIRSVEQVLASLEAFERREGKKADLLGYLNRLSLDSREEEDGPAGRKVSLMTLHGAKGLEFQLVFLIGMEEGLLPHSGMQGEAQNLEEERRLCYVGMTRARRKLFLTRAASRTFRGKAAPRTPSRFLDDIPEELFELEDLGAPAPKPEGTSFIAELRERLRAKAAGGAVSPGPAGRGPR